ncbi:DegT/DnrJ/EryC1/StrS family aminotransferase [Streptomyces sp. NPDC058678]|uniref:DegT/DnrJ/EryC1/StrS family aminotransferase n=1 Tax=Streptomyces sp. NPDC058678 TaxID=3346595 RepID=UPI00365C7BDB
MTARLHTPAPQSTVATRLAVTGGEPIVPRGYTLRSVWPRISEDVISRVLAQLRSGLLTEMAALRTVREFESEMAAYHRVRYALATNSGTAALHCALAGVGVEPGDEVVVPALSFIASVAAVIHQQGIPVFADVDPLTYNVTANSIQAALTERTKAVLVVHLHGLPADLDAIRAVTEPRGIPIIEDFAQAVGATYHGRPVGSIGAAGAASLMAGKNLPAGGEGGIVITGDRELRNRAVQLKCFGEAVAVDDDYTLVHETMGWNYRISLLAAVMASQQLFQLDELNTLRREGAAVLDRTLAGLPGFSPPEAIPDVEHVYHMYRFRFDPEAAGLSIDRDQAREALKQVFAAEGVPLVEFQNVPLPGHALMQRRVGYGRGCPWTCHGRGDLHYDIHDYPGALDAIRGSLVVGAPTQAAVANPEAVARYVECFEKVAANLRSFELFAAELDARAPWDNPARLF